MDQQWRHRLVGGNICPVCSNIHFPFCATHPNRRFQYGNENTVARSAFDFHGEPMGHRYPNDESGAPRHGHGNPNIRVDFYRHEFYGEICGDGSPRMPYTHGNNYFATGVDRTIKRIRLDEMCSSGFMDNSSRAMSVEDERRLKLIREHGGANNCLQAPQGGVGVKNSPGLSRDVGRYIQDSAAGVEDRKFETQEGYISEFARKMPAITEMKCFQESVSSSSNIRESFLHSEDYNIHHDYIDDKKWVIEEHFRSTYDGPHVGVRDNVDISHLNQPHMTQKVLDGDFGPSHGKYSTQNFQKLQHEDAISLRETRDSHRSNWSDTNSLSYNQRTHIPSDNGPPDFGSSYPYNIQHPGERKHSLHSPGKLNGTIGNLGSAGYQNVPLPPQHSPPLLECGYVSMPINGGMVPGRHGGMQTAGIFAAQPPLPDSPPPPPALPMDPLIQPTMEQRNTYSPPKMSPSLFPVPVPVGGSSAILPSSYPLASEAHCLTPIYFQSKRHLPVSIGFGAEESHATHHTPSKQYLGEGQFFPPKRLPSNKPKIIDASHLFKQPHRASRPDHFVIILRGLPGSGKSYFAKMLRDIEVGNGGEAPRIHSMDDYFMTEVEKVDESEIENTKSVRGKKPNVKKKMEFCYEPEMEEAYRSSMLKAFKKTLEEGFFTFIIVDDRNLRVADFAQFWATAKRLGYEVYILEATYKDPVGCAARNVHSFSQDDIQKMTGQWEETPSMYLQLDIKSLLDGDDTKENGIKEVDMDMEDVDTDGLSGPEDQNTQNTVESFRRDETTDGSPKETKRWDSEVDHISKVKELGKCKWSDDFDEDGDEGTARTKENLNALSGLVRSYGKDAKSVHWGDQVGNTGFSIGAVRRETSSLVIGPGAGYNLMSNPLPDEEEPTSIQRAGESKRQSVFQEQLRAECESFKAVFDRKRQRIGGLDPEEE